MKKFIFSLMFLLFVLKSFSQTPTSLEHSKDYYLKKSKNQKTTAWILLGTGTALIGVGLIDGSKKTTLSEGSGDFWFYALTVGVAADLASIPFFISSSKNKKRAASITINNQNILLPQQSSLCLKMQPAITLKINL